MPYDPSDARSALPTATATRQPDGIYSPAGHVKFYELPAVTTDGDTRTWYGRSQHLVIGYTDLVTPTGFTVPETSDECAVLMPEATTSATVTIDGKTTTVAGQTLTFIRRAQPTYGLRAAAGSSRSSPPVPAPPPARPPTPPPTTSRTPASPRSSPGRIRSAGSSCAPTTSTCPA